MFSEQPVLQTLIEATLKNRLQWTIDTSTAAATIAETRGEDIVVTYYYEKKKATLALFFNEETEHTRFVFLDATGDWLYEIDSDDEQDGKLVRTLFDVAVRQMSGVADIIQHLLHDFS